MYRTHSGTGELPNGFSRRQIAAALSPRHQELILLPTEKCNFRCTYCYEDFGLGKMSERTQRALENFIARRVNSISRLRLSWFGGEPLLAKDVILRIARFAKQRCEEHGVAFDGGMTTNAYLLEPSLAAEIVSLNQDFFQITLDGYGETHDVVRQRADGRGTFETIWRNLLSLKALKTRFDVVIRIHVRRDNQENLEHLMVRLAEGFRGDRRFTLDFQHLRDMGGEGGKTIINGVTYDELQGIERHLRSVFIKGLNSVKAAECVETQMPAIATNGGESAGGQRPSERRANEPYICYAGKANSLLIRANGRVGKCTVAFHDDRNDLGYLDDDGTVRIDNDKLRPWIRGLGSLDPEDTGCPIKQMQAGKPREVGTLKGINIVAS